jgi:putative ABC transport system ATP-binding protein
MGGQVGGARDPVGGAVTAEPGAIALRDVGRRYRVDSAQTIVALDGVTLDVRVGETVALWGPSGSGKSTLLHLIGALDEADAGSVRVGGRELRGRSRGELAAHRRTIGFIFQRFNLLPALTVLDNVMAPVLPYRVPFDRERRARELLAAVGLAGRETSLPSRLSGGQQQRVAIARALINEPPILLADEPTGNLDTRTGAEVLNLMLDLQARDGTTIVLATHDPQVAERCNRVIGLVDGRVTGEVDVRASADVAVVLADLARPAAR